MLKEINAITKQYFQKETLEMVTIDELQSFIDEFPYSSAARFLLAQKTTGEQNSEALLTAGLYINNPLRLEWLLENAFAENIEPIPERGSYLPLAGVARSAEGGQQEEQKKEESENSGQEIKTPEAPNSEPEPIIFQSYHTIDYFASQGIRLQQGDLTKDRFGQQLKSFTEWLRSMKRLPASEISQNPNLDPSVARNAATSIEEKEVMTEAMAEVWEKQGNRQKAISIYTKLSLQNPDKSAYFAAKIDQLK